MTFGFKKDKEKEKIKDKDDRHNRAPSPDDRPASTASRFAFGLRKKVSLASMRAHTPDDLIMSRTGSSASSGSSGLGHSSIPPIEETPASPIDGGHGRVAEDEHDGDEDVHAPDRFVKKNAWRTRHKMKLHPYPNVPYMQSYDSVVLENERYNHYLLRRLAPAGSPTFHDYGAHPPPSVLDLGCGTGVWLLNAARTWRSTQFVGLDLVDVAVPALSGAFASSSHSPTSSSASFPFPPSSSPVNNIRIVRSDFLKYALPFPDGHFALVRMANLGLCIPRARLEFVLKEVRRVLAPAGRLEFVEDEMLFGYGDAPIEEALPLDVDAQEDGHSEEPMVQTPTALAIPASGVAAPLLSPSTPRAPLPAPPTPDASGFFDDSESSDSSSELDMGDLLATDCASERSSGSFSGSSFAYSSEDAASTLVGSERGSVELVKKAACDALSQQLHAQNHDPNQVVRTSSLPSGAPQLDLSFESFRPGHGRGFSGVEHLVIEIPGPGHGQATSLPQVEVEPITPRHGHSASASTDSGTSTDEAATPSNDALPQEIRMLLAQAPSAQRQRQEREEGQERPPPGYESDDPHPRSPAPAPIRETSAGPWTSAREASIDVERLFQRMLVQRYGMSTASPLGLLEHLFSEPALPATSSKAGRLMGMERERGRVERPSSIQVKLAPVGVETREGVSVAGVQRESGMKGLKTWMSTIDWDEERPSGSSSAPVTPGGSGSIGSAAGKAARPAAPTWVPQAPVIPKGISAKAAARLGIAGGAGMAPQVKRMLPHAVMESPEGSEDDYEEGLSEEEEQEEQVGEVVEEVPAGRKSLSEDFWDDGDEEVSPVEKGRGASTWVPPSEWDAPPVMSREGSSSSFSGTNIPSMASDRTITAASSSRTITAANLKPLKQVGFATTRTPTTSLSLPPTPTASLHSRNGSTGGPAPPSPHAQTHTRGGSTASTASARSTASALSTASTSSSASSGGYEASLPDPNAPPRFSTKRTQHPGLLVWPATFIPVPPRELEMYATKHVQTVLGCKPALAEFVGSFVDEEGRRLVTEEEFEDVVWGYECFRRVRFNWPEVLEDRFEVKDEDLPPTPMSGTGPQHTVPPWLITDVPSRGGSDDEDRDPPHPFAPDELTHVRTLRVFSAVKGGVVVRS
ncbi:hypothetical protein C8R46DRAFT_1113323 [Mycena filopes]|nr:hypothetical protein C8R46DRAFT_1113323 [Mycena filopes]